MQKPNIVDVYVSSVAFTALEEVQEWVDKHGVDELRRAIAQKRVAVGDPLDFARNWLRLHDARNAEEKAAQATQLSHRATAAAERAARFAMWSAIVSAVATVVAAISFVYTFAR